MTIKNMTFCYVPAGPFIMGSDKSQDEDSEQPQKQVDLPHFYLGQFPVTNAQFELFVVDGGYQNDGYWPEAERLGYWKAGEFKGTWDNEPRSRPVRFSAPFNLPNHPVVGVSWFEALAFVRWLNDLDNLLSQGWTACLPTEAQWGKAARGGVQVIQDRIIRTFSALDSDVKSVLQQNENAKRVYPWGNQSATKFANYDETTIGATSAVGCFPGGASPYGCEEMSGNVWEWCGTKWRDNYSREPDESSAGKERRVLRGGSWVYYLGHVRCSARNRLDPVSRYDGLGFRVALSPFTLDSEVSGL